MANRRKVHNFPKRYCGNKEGTVSGHPVGSKEHRKDINLYRNHGITLKQFDQMFDDQGSKCAICGTREVEHKAGAGWCVDHCHRTGRTRGILCNPCNVGIAKLKDSKEILTAAIAYLTLHRELPGTGPRPWD